MPRSRRQRTRRTEAEREGIVRRFEGSGLAAREFCRREGLALSSLQRWRAGGGSKAQQARFIELAPLAPARALPEGLAVEIDLPSGVSVRVRG